jgi:hypothetical protein
MWGMGKRIFTPTPPKKAPKCIIFIFETHIFQRGGDTPPPAPHSLGASILAPSVLDGTPRKKSWVRACIMHRFAREDTIISIDNKLNYLQCEY